MRNVLPENSKIVEAIAPVVGTGASTGDYVSLKNAGLCFVLVHLTQAHAATTEITIEKAQNVAGDGSTPITKAVPIWANEDCAASDALVPQANGVGFTTSAALKHKQVILQIDPATLGDGFTCITVKAGASNSANIIAAQYILTDLRQQAETPPTAITD